MTLQEREKKRERGELPKITNPSTSNWIFVYKFTSAIHTPAAASDARQVAPLFNNSNFSFLAAAGD